MRMLQMIPRKSIGGSATESEKTAAENRFTAVNEANEVLSSEEKRKEYDFG